MTQRMLSADQRQWKFYFVLPVLVLPFVILLFFIFGGGKAKAETKSAVGPGINTALPDAHFGKKKEKNKFGLYEAATMDSVKHQGKSVWDFFTPDSVTLNQMSFAQTHPEDSTEELAGADSAGKGRSSFPKEHLTNAEKELELERKLQALQRQLDQPEIPAHPSRHNKMAVESRPPTVASDQPFPAKEFDSNPNKKSSPSLATMDPEIVQLNQMLDKLIAIQHPESRVDSGVDMAPVKTALQAVATESGNNTLSVTIPQHQTLVSGSTICLQLTEGATVGGYNIPEGQLIYGVVSLSNERLKILVHSLRKGKTIIPVSLDGYDLDGLVGVYIPGSIDREVSKESLDQGMGSLSMSTLDPSIGAQAASVGIQAAKTLLSRKVKLIRVQVPAGYQLLLKNTH